MSTSRTEKTNHPPAPLSTLTQPTTLRTPEDRLRRMETSSEALQRKRLAELRASFQPILKQATTDALQETGIVTQLTHVSDAQLHAQATLDEIASSQSTLVSEVTRTQTTLLKKGRHQLLLSLGLAMSVVIAAAILIPHSLQHNRRTELSTEIQRLNVEKDSALKTAAQAAQESAVAREHLLSLKVEIERISQQRAELLLALQQSTEMLEALGAAKALAQTELLKLQALQEKFRFKLLPGQGGSVFVETPSNALPFRYQGKTYVEAAPISNES